MTSIFLYLTLLFGWNAEAPQEIKNDPVVAPLGSAGGGCPGGRTCDSDGD